MDQEDPLEEGLAIHSSILAWRIPCTEASGSLQSKGLQSQTQLKGLHTFAGRVKQATYIWSSVCAQTRNKYICIHRHKEAKQRKPKTTCDTPWYFVLCFTVFYLGLTNCIDHSCNESESQIEYNKHSSSRSSISMLLFPSFILFSNQRQFLWEHIPLSIFSYSFQLNWVWGVKDYVWHWYKAHDTHCLAESIRYGIKLKLHTDNLIVQIILREYLFVEIFFKRFI